VSIGVAEVCAPCEVAMAGIKQGTNELKNKKIDLTMKEVKSNNEIDDGHEW
jgi:hypothetical protein